MEALKITRASQDEADTVLGILEEASAWLLAQGIKQWPARFDRQLIIAGIAKGEVFLARYNRKAVGTITLQHSDESAWGSRPPDSLYVHRLAVCRDPSCRGLGHLILDWAERRAVSQGKSFLRLDCWASNPRLREYYQDAGYTPQGIMSVRRRQVLRFEKPIDP